MKISVQVKTGKKVTKVEQIDAAHFIVHVTARPEKGRANTAILRTLAKHLAVAPSRLRIVNGLTGKRKIVEVE